MNTITPRMTAPIANLNHTTVMGKISRKATFVAMKEAPQVMTANRASKYGKTFDLDMTTHWVSKSEVIGALADNSRRFVISNIQ